MLGKNLNNLARFLDILCMYKGSTVVTEYTTEGYGLTLVHPKTTSTLYIEIQTVDPELDECIIVGFLGDGKLPSYAGDIQGAADFIKEQWKINNIPFST